MIPTLIPSYRLVAATVVASAVLALATGLYIQTKRLEQAEGRVQHYRTIADDLRSRNEVLNAALDNQNASIQRWQAEAEAQAAYARKQTGKAEALAQQAEELKQRILQNPPPSNTPNLLDWILSKEPNP